MNRSPRRLTRRHFMLAGAATAGSMVLAACGAGTPQVVEVEKVVTQVVEKEVTTVVKEIVKETVVVPTQQIVERVVTATPEAGEMSATQRLVMDGPGEGNFDPMSMGHWFANSGLKPALWCTLVGMDKDLNLFPWGAERWSFDESTMTWTFYIRKGMKFSDGSDITAKDFEYSMKRSIKHLDPDFHAAEVAAGRSGTTATFAHMMCNDIDGVQQLRDAELTAEQWEEQYADAITAVDDFTLAVRLAHVVPENLFMGKMAYNGSQCVKRENVEAGTPDVVWYENPVTSGPFVQQSHVVDQYRVLVPNQHYAGGDPPLLKEVTLRMIADAQTRLIAYENAELDVAQLAEADALEFAKPEHPRHSELMSVPAAVINYTWFVSLPPIDDVHVRRALIKAIDREKTVEAVFRGTAKFSPTYIPDYTPGWEMPPNYDEVFMAYDPEGAVEELKQSRYYDDIMSGNLPIRLAFTQAFAQGTAGRLYEAYVDQWLNTLGVEVKLQQTEFEMEGIKESLQNVRTNARGLLYADIDAWVGNVMAMYDPAGQYYWLMTDNWTKKSDVPAMAHIEDPDDDARFTQLWKEAAVELDQEKRLAMYQEWEYLREKWALEVPQYYPLFFVAAQPWVRDLEITPQWGKLFDRAWIARH